MSDDMKLQMELTHLREENTRLRQTISRAINVIEQIGIAFEEDDADEVRRLINEALGREEDDS